MKTVTSAQMREIEQRSVTAGVSLDALMENAGRSVADALLRRLPSLAPVEQAPGPRVIVLVGPGNNGADGFVAARWLAAAGVSVECHLLFPRPAPDPKRDLAAQAGAVIIDSTLGNHARLAASLAGGRVVLDAVLGTGQSRPVAEPLAGALRLVRQSRLPVVALDLPTGADADTGAFDPNGLPAYVTFVLGRPKTGLVVNPVASACRELETVDIGLPPGLDHDLSTELIDAGLARRILPRRPHDAHKGTFGRALIIAGSENYIGAGVLAARAASRSGVGLVELAMPRPAHNQAAGAVEEAIYRPLPVTEAGDVDVLAAGQEALRAAVDASAVLIGPGLGQGRATASFVNAFLACRPEHAPAVLDADALNIVAAAYRWRDRVPGELLLTPHPGEMARLLGSTTAAVQRDRLLAATSLASVLRATVVLKGAATVIAAPDGRLRISPWVNSGLARGGSGDALAGLIAGLLAQRPGELFDAAALGVYLHGVAADVARRELGEHGMTPGDVISRLPAAFLTLSGH
jgi:NAD(P)H-hydrate epimerase